MDHDNPEFKKLAFTAPGPKNSFAPLKRSDYIEKRKPSVTSSEEDGETWEGGGANGGSVMIHSSWPFPFPVYLNYKAINNNINRM